MADDRVGMSLDDLIKSDKSLQRSRNRDGQKKPRGGGGGGRGPQRGGRRRFDSPARRGRGGRQRGQRFTHFHT